MQVIDLGDEYCSEANDFINMFESSQKDGLHNLSKPNVANAEKHDDLGQPKESSQKDGLHVSKGNVANDEKQDDLRQPKEANFKLPHERYITNKRKYEQVIRSPFIEVKSPKVPSIDELKNRKNILDPIMVQMLRHVKPWVEVDYIVIVLIIL